MGTGRKPCSRRRHERFDRAQPSAESESTFADRAARRIWVPNLSPPRRVNVSFDGVRQRRALPEASEIAPHVLLPEHSLRPAASALDACV